jgi:hypothetical protein
MALLPLKFPPGIYRDGTEYQSKGRYYDCNLVRFDGDAIKPVGGWRKKARSGSLTNPFTTVNASQAVTVAHTAHGLTVGDVVDYAVVGATVGGLDMTGEWTVATVPNANSYTFTHTSAATSTVAVAAGGSVTYSYVQPVTGKARAVKTWEADNLVTWGAIGTHSKLYVMARTGQRYNITPAGFTAGRADATTGGGYGLGAYGVGAYGTPRDDATIVQEASVWCLAQFGQYLNAIMAQDGIAYEWTLNTASVAAAISGAPTGTALFVTEEGHLVILGAGGVQRRAQWSDQRDNTDWTPSATNQAGDFDLETAGRLMMGRRTRGGSLVWSGLDVHLMQASRDVFVFTFNKLAESCGAISRNCAGDLPNATVWMSQNGFYLYNGFVQEIPCEMKDYVFANINTLQASKVTCWVNAYFGEVTWFYPSSSSNENDRYVTWNYRAYFGSGKIVWTIGALSRLCGSDRGVMNWPWLVDASGYVYEHEVGWNYDGALPFLESGPIDADNGDSVMYAEKLVPDEAVQGQVSVSFKVKFWPNDPAEVTYGPYTLANPTWVRFCGRQIKVRYTAAANADWRIGVCKIDLRIGGKR